ncbi:MAG: hypothetical protein IJB86_06610 [Clostridia bacterium]|nr:hypothetical protein [Clostridia bacterium]
MDLLTYKCPGCAGAITFDSASQTFRCESCGTTFTEEQLDASVIGNNPVGQSAESYNWSENMPDENLTDVTSYVCESCGAEIVTDDTTVASECPYCNNPIIITDKVSGGIKPHYIIPFKIQKEQAIEALNNFYKGKVLLPKEFKDKNRIKEIKGVYVPFWLFDCDIGADMVYNATKVRHWSDSQANYTETSHYKVIRSGNMTFEKIPVDGLQKMDDSYMDAIEPFNYSEMIPFNSAYLSGYVADRFDVDLEQSTPRANERIYNTATEAIRATVHGYTTVTPSSKKIGIIKGNAKYALFPVWLLNTKYNDKMYTFAMNGQTGKLVGELPVDKKKRNRLFFGIAAAIAAVGQLLVFFM